MLFKTGLLNHVIHSRIQVYKVKSEMVRLTEIIFSTAKEVNLCEFLQKDGMRHG